MKNVAIIVGSLRADSINRKLAQAVEKLAAGRLHFTYADIAALPMYNDDLIGNPPPSVVALKKLLADADAVLFVTPEYNRTLPPLLTNAVAWGSRPYGHNAWAQRPAAVIGASIGAIGTAVAQSHLRSTLGFLDMAVLGQPEVYLQVKPGLFAADGSVTDEGTQAFLTRWVDTFAAWIDRYQAGLAAARAAE